MTLSEISIRNPVFAWMLMIGLMFFGYGKSARSGTVRFSTWAGTSG